MRNVGKPFAVIAALVLVLGLLLPLLKRPQQSEETTQMLQTRFESTAEIEFTVYTGPSDEVKWTIRKPEEVAEFVQEIRLVPKRPCPCAHTDFARFATPSGMIEVWFCGHWFDVLGRRIGYYQMPTNFYARIQRSAPAALREPPPVAPAQPQLVQ